MPKVKGKKYPYTKKGKAAAKKAAEKGKNPKDWYERLSKKKRRELQQAYETQQTRTVTGVRG